MLAFFYLKQHKAMKLIFLLLLQSCAFLHHVQVGEIRHKKDHDRMPFEIKVSETGVDMKNMLMISLKLSIRSVPQVKLLKSKNVAYKRKQNVKIKENHNEIFITLNTLIHS